MLVCAAQKAATVAETPFLWAPGESPSRSFPGAHAFYMPISLAQIHVVTISCCFSSLYLWTAYPSLPFGLPAGLASA